MKILIFGAGKIGRGFIGQIFSRGGYEVVFIDIDKYLIHSLNERKYYQVHIKDLAEESFTIKNVRGVEAENSDGIDKEILNADLLAVSVGLSGLPEVAQIIARALIHKWLFRPDCLTDIILAENLRDASVSFALELRKHLPRDFPFESHVGLVETSIGKMVPVMPAHVRDSDPLLVYAEAYNTLILDAKGFRNPIPEIEGLEPVNNIKAWVDRKFFLHNLGHALAAYFGNYYLPGLIYMHEVLSDVRVKNLTLKAMTEAGEVLLNIYPEDFSRDHIEEHISDLISRFSNRHLKDTIFRVGCDLGRKLGKEDRIATPIRFAKTLGLPFDTLFFGYTCALNFSAKDEAGNEHPEDLKFKQLYKEKGLAHLVKYHSGLDIPLVRN